MSSYHYMGGSPIEREKLARVKGHLEGYASYLKIMRLLGATNAREDRIESALRDDAAALAELLDIDGSLYLNGKEQQR